MKMPAEISELENRIFQLIDEEDYGGVIQILDNIEEIEKRKEFCGLAIAITGLKKVMDEYGEVAVTKDREAYERGRMEIGEFSPYQIFFEDEEGMFNVKEILDFIPEDNSLKLYYKELEQEN